MNAIKLLMQDHKKVRQLLSELEGTTTRNARDRQRLVQEISNEVNVHAQIEEEIFYPAFKEAARKTEDTDLFFEAAEEHHVVEMVLPELEASDPSSDEFTAKAKVLKELIEHHADEEEKEMFKRARTLMDEDQLEQLGTQLEERKMELMGEELELVGAGASSSGRVRNGSTSSSRASGNGSRSSGNGSRSAGRSSSGGGGGGARRGSAKTTSRASSSSSGSRGKSTSRKRK
jgi:hemerythrin-like domain-containing protein